MKKLFAVIALAATLMSLLAGCGAEKELTPIEKAQAKAVEIGQQYLDFEITAKEAKEMLDDIKVPETDGEGHGQLQLDVDIGVLSFLIGKQGSTYEDVKKKVEFIASQDYTD